MTSLQLLTSVVSVIVIVVARPLVRVPPTGPMVIFSTRLAPTHVFIIRPAAGFLRPGPIAIASLFRFGAVTGVVHPWWSVVDILRVVPVTTAIGLAAVAAVVSPALVSPITPDILTGVFGIPAVPAPRVLRTTKIVGSTQAAPWHATISGGANRQCQRCVTQPRRCRHEQMCAMHFTSICFVAIMELLRH
eukprot:scaffold88632_cov45-Prasinocladus_malaysianus.AAC.1